MSESANASAYGEVVEPATLKINRLLPGPIERVWSYLTEGDLRRLWLAAGDMEMAVGASFELIWRNDELTNPPGRRPENYGEEHRMQSRITELEPPRKLSFTWSDAGEVTFELEPRGAEVLLTIIHHRVIERSTLLSVSTGWHAHLDILAARLRGEDPAPFWDRVDELKAEYHRRLPA
ncbi:SRPBCC family protein [Parahaliea mediterranea]|uniref:SRPBCC family protein n=1 Tax=Parahaliea mediterranea TaxID=651086 RepID=A0A939DDQ9_9GAMM|nr:SRPBCC family protein [Parahaliea mediterranea]MBN7796204.1 SRPBCC family protein [Parahaliea mediterranea]